jgi:hypothetical protein
MKTTVTIISNLRDSDGNDVVFSMVIDGEQAAIEPALMSQAKIRVPMENGGSIWISQTEIKVITFRPVEEETVPEEE